MKNGSLICVCIAMTAASNVLGPASGACNKQHTYFIPEPQCSNRRPPEFIDGKLLKQIFHPIKHPRKSDRSQTAQPAKQEIKRQASRNVEVHGCYMEHRATAE